VLYEGISRPRRLAILTIVTLLAMASFGMLTSSCLFRFFITRTRLLYISSHQRKCRTPICDYCYHDCYQSHHSHFDYGTDSIFSKIHTENRFGTQHSIYDDHHYLR
jgi:hypothetical protein